MFESLPFAPRQVKATESRLRSIYDAARAGLRGELAEQKGRADSEVEMSTIMRNAALAGDAKMALEFLKHKHDWVAKQQVQVDVTQQISIITALEQAQQRLTDDTIDIAYTDIPQKVVRHG